MASVTRRPSTANERRGAVERRVVEAVERLLDGGASFTELSVQAIAEEAGIARSTFYVHFADKTQLLITLAQEATADIVAEGERWIGADHLVDIDQLTPSIERIIAVYRRNARLFEAVLAATGYDPAVAAFWRRHVDVLVVAGADRLRRAQLDGHLAPDVDIEPLASMVAWAIERTISMYALDHPESDDPALAASMARGLWLMMYGDAPRPG